MTHPIVRWLIDRKLALLFSMGFAIVCLSLAIPLLMDRGNPVLRMSAGREGTRRHAVATYLTQQAARQDLNIQMQSSAGSEDCLNRLKAGELDLAFVSNGVDVPDDDDIVLLGGVQVEALHLLVRKDMIEGGAPLLETIRGKRVNLGEKGSTEWLLAREALAFGRLQLPSVSHPGDVIPLEFGKAELIERAHAIQRADGAARDALIAELPDCLLVLATLPSTVVQLLVEVADYRLAPMPATRAFLMDNLQDSHANKTVVEREFLERTQIPANSYFAKRGHPTTDCETVGVRLLIVAHRRVPARSVRCLMQTLFEEEFSRRVLPKSPREIATPYAIHPAALAYLDRDKPLAINALIDWCQTGLSIFGAFSAGALSLYGLLWKKKVRSPSDYFAEIRKVDQLAHGRHLDSATAPIEPHELVRHLDDRLLQLRQDLIEDICKGRIKGDPMIANILALLKDTRQNLPKTSSDSASATSHLLPLQNRAAKVA